MSASVNDVRTGTASTGGGKRPVMVLIQSASDVPDRFDADLANELLRSPEFNSGMSGFFGGLLPTRTAQVAIGQAVRNILRAHVPEYRDALVGALADLPATSRWPAAASELVYRSLANVLLHPHTSAGTRRFDRLLPSLRS